MIFLIISPAEATFITWFNIWAAHGHGRVLRRRANLELQAFAISKNNYEKVYELLPANAATIGLHSIIGLLLCAGITVDKIFRI